MPRYDFACTKCGFELEVTLKLADHEDRLVLRCPTDGRQWFEQIIRPVAVEDWGNCSDGRFFEHLAPTGMRFRDKKSYKEHLKREGLQEWSPKRGMPGQVV